MKNTMFKYAVVITSVVLFSISVQAQDLIITNDGDSLNCKITKIRTDNIYFTFFHKGEIRSTLLPVGQVQFHQYNYYHTSEVPADKVVGGVFPHFRGAINGGWSNRVAKLPDNIPSDFEQYMKDLKSGYHFGLDLSYYLSEQLGLGIKFYNYRSKNEINNIYLTLPNGTAQFGKMSDDISINFIGPFVSTRLFDANKKNSFLFSLGMGYMGYTDKAVLISDFKIKGSTVGLCWDIGYEIGSSNFPIGVQISYMIGTLTQFDLSHGAYTETVKLEKENYESLSRIDLSVGLRLNK
jgi:hypothetical protein